jgi:hypothetical protein
VLNSSPQDHFVELTRGWLAADGGYDHALDMLRQHGVTKIDCVLLIRTAADIPIGDAKRLVHYSTTWADHREDDEHLENTFWRAMFIDCVLNGGHVNAPEEEAAECRDRQQLATGQLQHVAAELPDETLTTYRAAMAANRLGLAFTTLVQLGQQHTMPRPYWLALANAAETLCLNELLDNNEPADDELDEVRAARAVRRLTEPIG